MSATEVIWQIGKVLDACLTHAPQSTIVQCCRRTFHPSLTTLVRFSRPWINSLSSVVQLASLSTFDRDALAKDLKASYSIKTVSFCIFSYGERPTWKFRPRPRSKPVLMVLKACFWPAVTLPFLW